MTVAAFWIGWIIIWPAVCALIAQSRGMEWWVGALLGLLGCIGLVIVLVMSPSAGRTPHLPPPPAGAQWAPDPTGRHELRLWDGRQWTPNVSNGGVSGWDPLPGGAGT